MRLPTLVAQLAALTLGSACDPGDDNAKGTDSDTPTGCTVTPPAAWSAPEWENHAATALALRAQLDTLTSTTMRGAEQGTVVVAAVSDLMAPYEAGSPSLKSVVSPALAPIVQGAFAEFVDVLAAGSQDLVDGDGTWSPGAHGGLFSDDLRGINEGGIEVRQIVDKGLVAGGALYAWSVQQTAGAIDASTIDAIAAAWGADNTLSAEGTLTDSATYSHEMRLFDPIASALIAARAYAAAPECADERDAALVDAFRGWEASMAARFIYYGGVAEGIFAAPAGDADLADALHELGEGVGLLAGFHGLAAPAGGPLSTPRTITDAQLADLLDALGVDLVDLGASTTGLYVSDPAGFSAAMRTAEGVLAEAYGFTPDDIAAFRLPTGD